MKRGWCPSLHAPMPSGDGLLVRVKPPGARLDPEQAVALADACARFGNGVIELTQRGNLQIRGLSDAMVTPFAAAVTAAGLADPDPVREARRTVIPPALAGDDPGVAADAAAFTAGLEAAFIHDARLADLPGKFALAVDAGGVLGGRPVAADLVAWTDGHGQGLRVACRDVAPPPVGFLPYPGTARGAFGCAPPFGQLDAAALAGLAAVAARFGTTIRVTPWRALLLGSVDAAAPVANAVGPGFITDPADPCLLVTACPGAPACSSGTVAARADAARLRPSRPVHVSGCTKGCAHPGPAPLTLVGREGRYDVVQNGRANDIPVATGLTFEQAASFA